MAIQKLSMNLPESVRFPEGVNGEDLVRHLIAWYFYSCGNSEDAIKLTGETPVEVEKKLLEFGFSSKWMNRMQSETVRKRVEAMEIVKEADALAEQRVNEGWEEEDFKRDFLDVQKEIAGILKQKGDEKGK
jgi:hypothetical protein